MTYFGLRLRNGAGSGQLDYNGIISKFAEKKVIVIGDVMIDEYVIGDAERISPEAPVPVIIAKERKFALGGAANTANNIASLGAKAVLCGVMGKVNSDSSAILMKLLVERKITDLCVVDENRETARKTRIIARQQQMLRIDAEETAEIPASVEKKLIAGFAAEIKDADAVVISDYAKGTLTQKVSREIMRIAKNNGKITCVDSKNFSQYRNATIIKPNKKELEKETGKKCSSVKDCEEAALLLFKKARPKALLATFGAEGMLLFDGKKALHIESRAAEVFDVSGAGDTVIATAALSLSSGATMQQAAEIANFAASVVIRKLGTATLSTDELAEAIRNG